MQKESFQNKNPSIKILVGYHKPAVLLKDEILTPIHLGRALATEASKDGKLSQEDYEWLCENMIGDDTGDNISHLNRYFCELTGIYWAWKNYDKLGNPDYIGFMHYRRQFVFDESFSNFSSNAYHFVYEKIDEYLQKITDINQIDISLYDIISSKALNVDKSYNLKFNDVRECLFSFCEDTKAFYEFIELLKNDEKYSSYKHLALNIDSTKYFFPCNSFVMKKELFFEYCEFLFSLSFHIWHKFKDKFEKSYSKRGLAWISEHITSTFIKRQKEVDKKIKEVPLSLIRNTDNLALKIQLLQSKIKNEIKNAKVVSFDIFDTLLLRTYMKPRNVFKHLELVFGMKGFADERSYAEKRAMKGLKKEQVSFEEIYEFLPKKFHFLKDKEKELEYKNIYANKVMKEVFEYALSLNKKVFLVSDMYYDENFIHSLLDKCGIKGYDKLYVSSTYNLTKHSGKLFELVFDEVSYKKDEILHIGDNANSDYEMPLKYGIKALKIPLMSSLFFDEYKLFKAFYETNDNLSTSLILALLIKKCIYDDEISYYKYLGYFIGGPFIFATANFLVDEIIKRKLKDVFFVARDGYMIKNVFERILSVKKINDIKTSYIVANRSLNLLINLDLEKLNLNDNQKKIQSLFYLLCEQDENFKDTYSYIRLDPKEQYKILLENKDLLENISHLNKKFYKKYLQNFDFSSDNIAIFDGNASTFSSLRLLKSMLKNKNIFAFYYNVGGDEKTRKSFPFCAYEGAVKILNYPFSEFLMSANHYSKAYMKGENDFAENNDDFESAYKELFSLIQEHEEDFAKDMLDTFSNFKLEFDSEIIASYINFFLLNLSDRDKFHLKNLYIGIDPTHSLHTQIIKYNQVMHKPLYGSIKRTKEHLSYKLGEILLKSNNSKGILLCPFRLIKAFIIFKKNKNKKLPPLYLYKDYNESIKIKKQLTYRLGNLLVKHPFTFIFRARKIYKEWKINKS